MAHHEHRYVASWGRLREKPGPIGWKTPLTLTSPRMTRMRLIEIRSVYRDKCRRVEEKLKDREKPPGFAVASTICWRGPSSHEDVRRGLRKDVADIKARH